MFVRQPVNPNGKGGANIRNKGITSKNKKGGGSMKKNQQSKSYADRAFRAAAKKQIERATPPMPEIFHEAVEKALKDIRQGEK